MSSTASSVFFYGIEIQDPDIFLNGERVDSWRSCCQNVENNMKYCPTCGQEIRYVPKYKMLPLFYPGDDPEDFNGCEDVYISENVQLVTNNCYGDKLRFFLGVNEKCLYCGGDTYYGKNSVKGEIPTSEDLVRFSEMINKVIDDINLTINKVTSSDIKPIMICNIC